MKRALLLCAFVSLLFGGEFQKGDLFAPKLFTDQFDQNISLNTENAIILVAFDKAEYYDINLFLKSKEADYLKKRDIYYLNDISTMPEGIWSYFVKPQMQTKNFSILLIMDQNVSLRLGYQEGKITIYHTKQGKISKIDFVDAKALGDFLPR